MTEKFLAELEGNVTGTRVLSVEEGRPEYEYSYAGGGTFDGQEVTDVITYVVKSQTDGVLFGTADGVITVKNGQDIAVWHGTAIGQMGDNGTVEWKGSLAIQSSSPAFQHLNGTFATANVHIDRAGKLVHRYKIVD